MDTTQTETVANNGMDENETAEYEAFKAAMEQPSSGAPKPEDETTGTVAPVVSDQTPNTPKPSDSGDAADPFEGLPQAVKDMLADVPRLRSIVETQGQELARWKGQTQALQSKLDKAQQRTPTEKPARDALRKTLPEIAAALDEVDPLIEETTTTSAPNKESATVDAVAAPAAATIKTETVTDPNELALDLARPSWFMDMESTDFKLYMATLPKDKQREIMATNDARVIMAVLNDFDKHKERATSAHETEAARARRIAAGLTPQGDGRRGGRAPAAALTPEQIEQQAMEAAFTSR